jgi:hypothetical protein
MEGKFIFKTLFYIRQSRIPLTNTGRYFTTWEDIVVKAIPFFCTNKLQFLTPLRQLQTKRKILTYLLMYKVYSIIRWETEP